MRLEVKKILENLKEYGESEKPVDNIVFAMNQSLGGVKNRIFNSEEGAKSVNGAGLGKYSNSYAQVRRSKGRQTNVIDLEFTGSLRRDIKVVKDDNIVTMAIVSNSERTKAENLEKLFKKSIFKISQNEQIEFYETLAELVKMDIQSILEGES